MDALEELTETRIKELSPREAEELYNERNLLQSRLRKEMALLRQRFAPIQVSQPKCPCCAGKTVPMGRGGWLCEECGFRWGKPEDPWDP